MGQFVTFEFNFFEEIVCHLFTCLSGPCMEEVDGATVDDSWELGCSFPEQFAHGGHAQDHLQVAAHLENEVFEQLFVSVVRVAVSLRLVLQCSCVTNLIFFGHQFWDVSGVHKVIDADQELFFDDLTISDDQSVRLSWLHS